MKCSRRASARACDDGSVTLRAPSAMRRSRASAGTTPCTSRSWLETSGSHGACSPGADERPLRVGQQRGVPRRIDARSVEQRIGGRAGLDADVAGGAGVGPHAAAVQHRERPGELVALRVVDHVARDDDEGRVQRVDAHLGRGEHLCRERLLRPERRGDAIAERVDDLDAQRRLLVGDVDVRDLREDRERPCDASGRGDVGAVDERLARPPLEQADAAWISERASQRRAGTSGAAGRSRRGRSRRRWPRPARSRAAVRALRMSCPSALR